MIFLKKLPKTIACRASTFRRALRNFLALVTLAFAMSGGGAAEAQTTIQINYADTNIYPSRFILTCTFADFSDWQIQSSTNLIDWVTILDIVQPLTNDPPQTVLDDQDVDGSSPMRFYRMFANTNPPVY